MQKKSCHQYHIIIITWRLNEIRECIGTKNKINKKDTYTKREKNDILVYINNNLSIKYNV